MVSVEKSQCPQKNKKKKKKKNVFKTKCFDF